MTITLQPVMTGDRLPYPFHVAADGAIDRQDFWRGKPERVIGISDIPVAGHMIQTWQNIIDVRSVLGTYLVVSDADGQWSTMTLYIERVTDLDGTQYHRDGELPDPADED